MTIKSSQHVLEEVRQLKAIVAQLEESAATLHETLRRESEVPFSIGKAAMFKYESARVELCFKADSLLRVEAILDPEDEDLGDLLDADPDDPA